MNLVFIFYIYKLKNTTPVYTLPGLVSPAPAQPGPVSPATEHPSQPNPAAPEPRGKSMKPDFLEFFLTFLETQRPVKQKKGKAPLRPQPTTEEAPDTPLPVTPEENPVSPKGKDPKPGTNPQFSKKPKATWRKKNWDCKLNHRPQGK